MLHSASDKYGAWRSDHTNVLFNPYDVEKIERVEKPFVT